MANVIKHKRGSGSDPSASDLVVGEVAIRTDTGKLFTKMDNGSVAEIAGGGSDIAINTLSSSSATGGGSATFNGSAYRFTLSAPPSVSAQQLLVSINGVIQKPVAGTGQPSEGFSVDGNDIILGDAPATGADFFIITFKSLGVSEPADNSVTSAKIVDGAIVNADINASAAIAGTKIAPDFGSQNISTTGRVLLGTTTEGFADADDLTIATSGNTGMTIRSGTTSYSSIFFSDATSGSGEYDGFIQYNHNTQKLTVGTGATGSSDFAIDSSGNIGIGTTSPTVTLDIEATTPTIRLTDSDASGTPECEIKGGGGDLVLSADRDNEKSSTVMQFQTDGSTAMTINSSQQIGIGTTSPGSLLTLNHATNPAIQFQDSGTKVASINAEGSQTNIASFEGKALVFATSTGSSFNSRMIIDTSGNVGIGTTSPSSNLHIASSLPTIRLEDSDVASGASYSLITSSSNGNIELSADPDNVRSSSDIRFNVDGTERMRLNSTNLNMLNTYIDFSGSISTPSTAAAIYRPADNTLAFSTANTERFRIDSVGDVEIMQAKKLRWVFAAGSTHRCSIGGEANDSFIIRNGSSDTLRLTIDSSGNIGAPSGSNIFNASDSRLKKNVVDLDKGLSAIKSLRPVSFKWIDGFCDDEKNTLYGFIAQEVQTVDTNLVQDFSESSLTIEEQVINNPLRVNEKLIIPMLVKAVQELEAKLEALEAN